MRVRVRERQPWGSGTPLPASKTLLLKPTFFKSYLQNLSRRGLVQVS